MEGHEAIPLRPADGDVIKGTEATAKPGDARRSDARSHLQAWRLSSTHATAQLSKLESLISDYGSAGRSGGTTTQNALTTSIDIIVASIKDL